MGYRLEIAPNVQKWLADLRERSPDDAQQVDKALDALSADGLALGPPLVAPVDLPPGGGDMLSELDYLHDFLFKALSLLRAEAAEAATLRATLEGHLDADQSLTGDQRELLRSAYAGIRSEEAKATQAATRMFRDVEAFRVRKDVLRASCAEALIDGIELAVDASMATGDEDTKPPRLMELRPGAPGRVVARLLFTAPDQDRAEIITAATENQVLRAWYRQAVPAVIPEYGFRSRRTSDAR